MGNRTAKFISALIGSIIAGAPLAAVSQNAPSAPSAASTANAAASTANAAADCLASPKGAAPQGQHWFYRLERSTKRQCWYLRAEGLKATQSAQATTDTPDAAPTAPQSLQNAHAEYIAPQTSSAASAPAPAAATMQPVPGTIDANAAQPAVATRWPDAAPASPSPQPSPATTAAPAAASVQPSAKPAASPAPVTLATADSAADKPTGSLQTLLLVIVGALTLAGLIASMIYRFAGGRSRVQAADRRVNWDHRQDDDGSRAPWHTEPTRRVERPRPVDFDAMRVEAPQIAAFSNAIGRIAAPGRSIDVAAAEPDETEIDYFDGEFEIEAPAPQLAADDVHHEEAAEHDAVVHEDHAREEAPAVDIDIITAMLERLATEGPRLTHPSPDADLASLEADLAALAQSSRGQSAARA
ncbi:hypothetical protein [Bradyrhizobium sp. WSM3983]|uniref:hypothetical protein n=1 Tax=Bradyrhizobium sp. WSM3983 TaxID=1038867 RepID=UPI0003FCDE34|nr:hypothetical protein [Bradyrhizobium sp. WSM3983]